MPFFPNSFYIRTPFNGAVGETGPVPTLWVDEVDGSDANSGRAAALAKQTLAGAVAVGGDNEVIGLKRGSFWRETLDLSSLAAPTAIAYGSGAPPRITGMDIVPNEDWSQLDGAYPSVYSATVTHEGGGRLRVFSLTPNDPFEAVLEQLIGVADLAACEATPGSFVRPTYDSPATIHIHPADGLFPPTSGVAYGVTVRTHCITGLDNCTVNGIETGEALSNNGSVDFVARANSVLKRAIGSNGSKHNLGGGNGTIEDCVAVGVDATTPEEPSNAAFVAFLDNPAGKTAVFRRCGVIAHGVGINNDYIAHGNPNPFDFVTIEQGWVVATGDYNVASMNLNKGCYYKGVSGFPGNNGTLDMVMCEVRNGITGGPSPGFYTPTLYKDSVLLRQQQPPDSYQEVFRLQGTHHAEISHCSFYLQTSLVAGNNSSWCNNGNSGQDIDLHHTVFFNGTLLMRWDGGTYVGDYNVFLASIIGDPSSVHFYAPSLGYFTTLGGWQTATGQEANSVYLARADQVRGNAHAFWLGVSNDENDGPEDGDWRINPNARVYSGADVAYIGTFPDGTPITAAGPQNRWDWDTRASVAGPPVRWPVVPSSLSEARTYVNNPEDWSFYP